MIGKTRGLLAEFKSFAIKGNALELAVAVVVGTAFTGIVNSLVADIITPLMGAVSGNVDFKTLAYEARPEVLIRYGAFLQAIFNFFVISVSIFFIFKALATARRKFFAREEKELPPHEKPAQERLLEEIRDLLRDRK